MKAAIFDFTRTLFDPEKGELYPGAFPLLEFFRNQGWRLALLSRAGEGRQDFIASISYFFEIIKVVSDKSLEDFQEIAARLGLNPSDLLIIGDRIKREIVLGNRMGAITIWLKQGKFKQETPDNKSEEPHYIFESLSEITTFLKNNQL